MDTSIRRRTSAYRVLLGVLFLAAGTSKLFAPSMTTALIASRGLPNAHFAGFVATAVEMVGGGLLLLDWQTRWVAGVLSAFVVAAAAIFHFPVVLVGPQGLELAFDVGVLALLLSLIFSRDNRQATKARPSS